jgi:hypothetical protein
LMGSMPRSTEAIGPYRAAIEWSRHRVRHKAGKRKT